MTSSMNSWVTVQHGSDFPIQNLPYGVFSDTRGTRCGAAIGDAIVDLAAAEHSGLFANTGLEAETFSSNSLNAFIAQGRAVWSEVRTVLTDFLEDGNTSAQAFAETNGLIVTGTVDLLLPITIGDYVDFYSSEQHATNLGKMFRPDGDALLPNWKHLPVGYHGRAGTVVVSGTDITRPTGQRRGDDGPVFGPSMKLDIELEVGFVTGDANGIGESVDVASAEEHIFGMCLVNDWSARDIQGWEYVPLGPFLGKSFATTISPWIVTLDALKPFRIPLPDQDTTTLPYLDDPVRAGVDIDLTVDYIPGTGAGTTITRTNFTNMYWSMAQQLAHATVNGATARAGDLFASGTVSGPGVRERGSLIETTWNGRDKIAFPDGATRTFLEDGDTIEIRGTCEADGIVPIGFGECTGTIVRAPVHQGEPHP
jgi:fumarylacetoacetase